MNDPLRKVVRVTVRTSNPHDQIRPVDYSHFLECGHVVWARASWGKPKRKRCISCGMIEVKERLGSGKE